MEITDNQYYSWKLSNMTVNGRLSGIVHNEFKTIRKFNILGIDPKESVAAIRSNEGIVYNKNDQLSSLIKQKMDKKQTKNTRTREQATQKGNKRPHKLQGLGIEFNSAMSFYVMNPQNPSPGKVYIIKIFRDGKYNFLGALKEDYSDFFSVMNYLIDFLERFLRRFETIFPEPEFIKKYNSYLAANNVPIDQFIYNTTINKKNDEEKPDQHSESSDHREEKFDKSEETSDHCEETSDHREEIVNASFDTNLYKWVYDAKLDPSMSINLQQLTTRIIELEEQEVQKSFEVQVVRCKYTSSHSCVWIAFHTDEPYKKASEKPYITAKLTGRGKINLNGRKNKIENERIKKYLMNIVHNPKYYISKFVADIPSSDEDNDD